MLGVQGILYQAREKGGHIAWTNYHTRGDCPVRACSDIVAPDLGVPLLLLDVAR